MKTFNIYEPTNIYDELYENLDININDIIIYYTFNQLGIKKYIVILDDNGDKDIKLIDE